MTSYGDFGDDEEDVKPSVEYLNSLGDYRKRSRSADDVGSPGPVKTPKINGLSTPNGFSKGELSPAAETPIVVDSGGDIQSASADDPMVMGLCLVSFFVCASLTICAFGSLSERPAYTILTNH